jgi:hypothetical protein
MLGNAALQNLKQMLAEHLRQCLTINSFMPTPVPTLDGLDYFWV